MHILNYISLKVKDYFTGCIPALIDGVLAREKDKKVIEKRLHGTN